ncbi:MFS transporter [Ktedonosporobacter rubrisoli]|uniref:MFS transporter n=1 Tax=Ktedonosporobacter rubrisoli TaxID=2509675 RepID=UPI0013EE87EF|nr:MFS transporter [Ktedonosporobacter rubrisoli]
MKSSSAKKEISQEGQTGRGRWLVVVVVSLAIFLDTVDVSIVNIALPNLQHDLHLSTTDLQWVQGIYVLTYAGFMLLGGRAADLLGRRCIFLLGAALFGLSALAGGLAPNGGVLILTRGAQGIGAALTMPSAVSILTTTFAEGPERNKALGIFSSIAGVGFTCGLVLGGVLTSFVSWHWIFFVNVPIALLILLLARVVVPEGQAAADPQSYDLAGAATATAGLLLLVYAVTQANEPGTTAVKTGGLIALALALLLCFIFIERRSRAPLMPFHIFQTSRLGAVCIVTFALIGAFFSFLFVCTLYLQDVLHYSPIAASLAMLPSSVISILTTRFLAPWLMNRFGMRSSCVLGMLSLLAGVALFLRIGANADFVGVILPSTILAQIGMAICVPTTSVAAVIGIEQTEQGLAAGLSGALGQAGGGILLAVTAAVVTVGTTSALRSASALSTQAQLSGYHAGLLVIVACAALGALVALFRMQK